MERKARPRRALVRAAAVLVIGAALLVPLLLLAEPEAALVRLLAQVEALGWAAPLAFVILHAMAVVLLLPGMLFPLAAGLLFGVAWGTLVSVAGKVLGSVGAVMLARRISSADSVERSRLAFQRHSRLERFASGLDHHGWRTVVLVRLMPLIPFKLSSYVLAWTRLRLRDIAIGTAIGAIPYSLLNAYLGSLGANLAALRASDRAPAIEGRALVIVVAISVITAVVFSLLAVRLLRSTIRPGTDADREKVAADIFEKARSRPPR